MTVLAILSVLTSRVVLSAADQYMSSAARLELSQEMSAALDRMTTELRQVRLSNISTPDIAVLTSTSIEWNDSTGKRSIYLSGSQLLSLDSVGTSPILSDVTSFSVQGYDDADSALPASPTQVQLAGVRRLEFTITCQREGVSEMLRTRVFLRMFMAGGSM